MTCNKTTRINNIMARFGIQWSGEKAVLTLERNYIRPRPMFAKIVFTIGVKQNSLPKDSYLSDSRVYS